ncbi:MAG: hypothetical protein EPO09_09605 [Aquabacterium sp.]|uniref:hypothetical protein n=1 Tax=Aquabacterium sp. TaxID=1872578 RepID=UPI001219EDCA|nr:hypothetical protein [Aquabacterium sp.]TAK94445.1 MAG: hypothetical protein EPO09_09605 [Aquabacterium sp.]
MWKLLVGFAIFAALAVFLLMKGGANVDMSGEKHGVETSEPAAEVAPASAPASVPAAASEAASAASQ